MKGLLVIEESDDESDDSDSENDNELTDNEI